ncbi:MAG: YSC84-related protein [Kangiellaceae bacterium]|nr:YSC84-related protein [Kangiellaceae bacterium]MCW8999217.1 YSC84-related protein [Kangiellaceae bacterium]
MRIIKLGTLLALVSLLAGCATMSGSTPAQKRQSVMNMKNEVLTELFKLKPDTRKQVSAAPGYAVFSNVNVNIIFASFGGGYGMAKNNKTGKVTYMKMGEVGLGLGAGVKDFRAVFVFHTKGAYDRFIEHGWTFGGQADAAAKASDKGAAVAGEAIIDNVSVYQLTQSGLALQATLKGTKYWVDEELN